MLRHRERFRANCFKVAAMDALVDLFRYVIDFCSTGVSTLLTTAPNEVATEFEVLRKKAGFTLHPTTPKHLLRIAFQEEAFQTAKALLFPDDVQLSIDRKEAVRRWLKAIPALDPESMSSIMASIRESLADEPHLQLWFDAQTPAIGPTSLFRVKPNRFGFNGHTLALNAELFGVRDVHAAAQLATKILGLHDSELVYDL